MFRVLCLGFRVRGTVRVRVRGYWLGDRVMVRVRVGWG